MMVRTQISLDGELHRRARVRSGELGLSLAEYVRRLIGRDLGGVSPGADPAVVFNLGTTGGADIARHKDAYIAEAMGGRRPARHGDHAG